ncbi:MAG: TIGR03936 family radical SAM-associated protein [Eubacterium sp.]
MSTIRFKFSRSEALRFISHLDQQRLFQRAFRRAGMSISHSNGFNPHPKLAFALAMSVGLISDCEYGDVTLEEDVDLMDFIKRLNGALPRGLLVFEAWAIPQNKTSLSASLTSSRYTIEVDLIDSSAVDKLENVLSEYLSKDEIIFQKRNKKGKVIPRNIRLFIKSIEIISKNQDSVCLDMNLLYIEQQCIKPEIILQNINDVMEPVFKIDPTIVLWRKDMTLD